MRAESHPARVIASAVPVRGRLHQHASARQEILVAASIGPADARSLATSTLRGGNTLVQQHIASGTAVHGRFAITALTTIKSRALHPSIDLDQPRPGNPPRHPQRLADRQLPRTD